MPRPRSSRAMRCGEPTSARRELHRLAARLGADVPFALMGGTAIGTGRGDQLSPALAKGRFDWVVVPVGRRAVDPRGLRAPGRAARRTLTSCRAGARRPPVDPGVLQALRAGDPVALAERVRNDLQAAALSLRPQLRDALELGEQSGALVGLVSGSGPTLAFLAGDPESALELQVTLSAAGLRGAARARPGARRAASSSTR